LLSQEALPNPAVCQNKSKSSLLPLLIVLFVVSYGLMVMLVIEQSNTITNQRWLIRQLFADSSELSSMKAKSIQKQNAEAQAQTRSKAQSQAPSIQAQSEERASNEKAEKPRRVHPQHPPKPAADTMDARRALIAI
jgi:cytoskeletal protein RodZ